MTCYNKTKMPYHFLGNLLNNTSGKNNFTNVISFMASAVPLQIKGHCEQGCDIRKTEIDQM